MDIWAWPGRGPMTHPRGIQGNNTELLQPREPAQRLVDNDNKQGGLKRAVGLGSGSHGRLLVI